MQRNCGPFFGSCAQQPLRLLFCGSDAASPDGLGNRFNRLFPLLFGFYINVTQNP